VLIDGGESVTVVARRLGHANPSETLRTYSHLWPESDERTRQVVEAAFGRSGHAAIGGDQTVGSMGDG
jgi:integrase